MKSLNRHSEYMSRINRVIDYIDCNIDKYMTLNELANIANFSPYHFHRIFKAIVGETINNFIQRVRIEKAAMMLVSNPKKSITEIAFDTGFSSSASFARAFKEYFKMNASQWRKGGYGEYSNINQTVSKNGKKDSNQGKEYTHSSCYDLNAAADIRSLEDQQNKRSDEMENKVEGKVEVRKFPEMTVAYIRHIGPYQGDAGLFEQLWNKLMKWAGPRELLNRKDLKCLCVYHDDPNITEQDKLRVSVCISVPENTSVDGEVGKMKVEGGKYAAGYFEIDPDQYQQAWDYMFGQWLPPSGYQPDDRACFEMFLNNPEEHPQHKHQVEICIPVKPL